MTNIFFTSDTHFGHKRIIEYQPNRALLASSVDDMNEVIIRNWNNKVKPSDVVYHLGDVAFLPAQKTRDILNRLNGRIIIILGNHDSKSTFNNFEVHKDKVLRIDNTSILLSHKPIETPSSHFNGLFHFYGHLHGREPTNLTLDYKFHKDVGVDTTLDLAPIEWGELNLII